MERGVGILTNLVRFLCELIHSFDARILRICLQHFVQIKGMWICL